MSEPAAFPVMLSPHEAVSFDTSPGPRPVLLPGRSDQLRYFALRDHAGRLSLEGKSVAGDVPVLGFDFGAASVSRSAPMDAVPLDRSSSPVGRGGVSHLFAWVKRCFMSRH